MASMRVHELAKEFDMSSKELLDKLQQMKIPAKSHASMLADAYVDKIRKNLEPEIKQRAGQLEDEEARKLAGSGRVTADSADPRMIAELRRRGLSVEGAKKGPGSVEHGMRWLQELGRIVIDPKACPNAAREFAAYEYERDRWGNFKARYPDQDNHAIDAARYGCEDIMAHRLARVGSKSGAGLF